MTFCVRIWRKATPLTLFLPQIGAHAEAQAADRGGMEIVQGEEERRLTIHLRAFGMKVASPGEQTTVRSRMTKLGEFDANPLTYPPLCLM